MSAQTHGLTFLSRDAGQKGRHSEDPRFPCPGVPANRSALSPKRCRPSPGAQVSGEWGVSPSLHPAPRPWALGIKEPEIQVHLQGVKPLRQPLPSEKQTPACWRRDRRCCLWDEGQIRALVPPGLEQSCVECWLCLKHLAFFSQAASWLGLHTNRGSGG